MPRLFHEAIIFERIKSMGLEVHDVHFPSGGAAQVVIVQVEPATDGLVTDALLSALWGPWANIKMAIAVNPDIDIYDYRDGCTPWQRVLIPVSMSTSYITPESALRPKRHACRGGISSHRGDPPSVYRGEMGY